VIPAAGPITVETHSPPYAPNTPSGFRSTYPAPRTFNGLRRMLWPRETVQVREHRREQLLQPGGAGLPSALLSSTE
jgi:hypothetical protein